MENLPPFQKNKSLKEVSTFAIGGEASFFVEVTEISEMQCVLSYCAKQEIPFIVLGKGSNCLFDDRGFDGLVIQNKIAHFEMKETEVDVGAGYSFSMLGLKTAKMGFSGLEFASGIPASVGGAVFMNAGANGTETASCLRSVSFVTEEGVLLHFDRSDLEFSYRFSSFQMKKGAIVAAKFSLKVCPEAREKQLSIVDYRLKTQPTRQASAGCVFRNPEGYSAGALIEKSGLKGLRVGGAMVSDIHANFIVNPSGASAQDVLALAALVQEKVKKETGIHLEMEIRCIPNR
jgi:UDP-N-acetylmuramate dehydrogenase